MSETTYPQNKMTISQLAMSRTFLGGFAILLFAGIATLAVILTGNSNSQNEELTAEPMPVQVISANWEDSVNYQRIFVGQIKAKRKSDLGFERSAKIIEIKVDDGDAVNAGQDLAVLDKQDLEIAKRKANASLKNAEAILAELRQGPRKEVIEAAQSDVKAFEAELTLAKSIKQKRQKLFESDSISNEEWDEAQSRFDAAVARLAAAKSKLDELLAGTRTEKKDAQQALVEQLKTQLADVELQIEKSTLKAPYTGAISMRYLDEGVIVASGTAVLQITESSQLEAVVGLPPVAARKLKIGDQLICVEEKFSRNLSGTGTESANRKNNLNATVSRILPETDERTRMVPVVFELDSNRFKPGELVRIQINEARPISGIWVPTVALVPRAKGLSSVYVVQNENDQQLAQLIPVSIEFNIGDQSLVKGSIAQGDLIISNGVHRITGGQLVSVLDTE